MSYTFLRWARFGVAAALDGTILEAGGGPRAHVSVGVSVSGTSLAPGRATLPIDVLGPGDVAGLDHRQVIRTFPVAGTFDFENTYCAHVEIDRPDLPWLFTPTPPTADGSLRPWMCLAVVEKRENAVKVVAGTPLPRLVISGGAAAELPSMADLHRWAHVQITGSLSSTVDVIARDQPERILSRLVCPRKLVADTSYIACVVPTYNVGVDAGLGRDVAAGATLADAWGPATDAIELPVYYHWEFSTGNSGDFKSLVTRLQARTDLPGVGTRVLDTTTPGFGVEPRAATTTVDLGGALRVTPPAALTVNDTLPDDLLEAIGKYGLTPPIYGRWHAAASVTKRSTRTPGWLEGLNLDPRYRVAAGLGTKVVQDRQEDLMAAIWEQFGEILRANQILRHAQLAVAASERIVARHLWSLPDLDLLAVAGPAFGRIRLGTRRTVRRTVVESCAPIVAFSGAFRRLARTRGPLVRRLSRLPAAAFPDLLPPPATTPNALLAGLSAGTWNVARPALPDGAIAAPASVVDTRAHEPRPGRGETQPRPLAELLHVFARLARADKPAASCQPLDSGALAAEVRQAITPDVAIPPRVRAQLRIPADPRLLVSDRLDPIMAAPEIPLPMIGPLIELGQDWLLPGLVNVPPNVTAIVEPDAAFIEAYMVGLNHEMGRELLWRGFPTDQRGTVFSRFWDRRAAIAPAASALPDRDIPGIATWKATTTLGANMDPKAGVGLVLLIRGDLLQRYPRTTIYLQRAQWKRDPTSKAIVRTGDLAMRVPVPVTAQPDWDAHVRFPSLTGRAGVDVTYLGFPLWRAAVHGLDRRNLPDTAIDAEAGWFVVFQEQPTEPRFGTPPATGLPAHADNVAAVLMRQAFRLFVHGSDLVGA